MSKMPAKKKSCFQITSVTQAQVAASSATDDTESLDEPDESRTEDVSSEIFDVSRADYEPVCDRSSSEETLNNVDPEAPGFMALQHIPQVVQLSAMPCAPNGGFRKVGVARSTHGGQQALETGASTSLPLITQSGVVQQPAPAASGGATNVSVSTSQPIVTSSTPTSTTSTASCSSRFRVIKLDHGTGEPFRRGRWTCMEFYEKDSEGSVVSRTVDSIRHANALDPSADRDSGLGLTGGSVVAPSTLSGHGLDSVADAALTAPHVHPVETLQQQQLHHQSYGVGQQAVTGTTMQNAFSNNKTMTGPTQQPVAQPAAPQNLLPVGHNGLPQGGIHIQKSPSMPPAAQAQPLSYPPQQQQQHIIQQLPLGHHHLPNQSSGVPQNQADYYQQHQPVMQAVASTGQTLPVTSLCVGQPVGQGPSQVMTAAAGGALMLGHVGEMAGVVGGSLPVSQPAPGLLQQTAGGMGGVGVSMLGGGLQQQPVGQYAPSGQQPQLHSLHSAPSSGVQNVPAVAVSTGIASVPTTVPAAMPSASSAAHAMPNLNPPSLLPVQQAQMPRNGGAPGSLGGVQGLSTAGFGQVEESMRKATEGLASQPPVFSGKDLMKPFIPESLQLASPSVNSLFGIPIPIDGDEDRNPSMAFYQAFQSGSRLRDSKAHSDSASGASVVAIDNKIEQAMDLVKSHLMYAVREEVEVLKEQIKELFERNSMLERENAVLKSLANSDQLSQLSVQPAASNSCSTPPQQMVSQPQPQSQLPALALPQAQPQPQVQPQAQSQPQLQPQAQHLQPQPQIDPSQPPQQPPPNVTSA